ncbi:MAG: flavin reductase family protein [Syntrophothermus sp.]
MSYMQIDPSVVTPRKLNSYLLGAIGPRPIAFASTIDKKGNPNLAPFSFFNIFGVNPPLLIFSPSRRGKDNTTKHTYENIKETSEVVINVVSFGMVEKVNIASAPFPREINEFNEAGFTMEPSVKVKPFRVKESPVQFECNVIRVVETGLEGYAGNLIICRIELMHLNAEILDENGLIDPHKIDLVGRLGGNNYCRASGDAVFSIPMPADLADVTQLKARESWK